MTPERRQQIKEVFNSALKRAGPERSSFLDHVCASDEFLRSEVESLVSSHGREGRLIDTPPDEGAAGVLSDSQSMIASGQTLGSYRVLSTLGRGGMGEVYLAEDSRLGRKVALKLLPSSFTSDADVSGKPTLWRVSIDGGTPVEITNRPAIIPIVSPDGKFIAYLYPDSIDPLAPPNRMAIMPIEGGEPIKTISFQGPTITGTSARWSGDGRSIFYTVSNNNATNIWSQPVDGGPPRQVTDFKDSLMTGFAWSADGKTLACTRGVLTRDAVLISEVK